jgi:endonuclease YncB( thermonuclease family)
VAAAGLLVILIIADRRGWLLARRPDDMTVYDGASALVARVVDGDTLEIRIPDRAHRRSATQVRLWGVNCPEARALTAALTAGGPLTLTLDAHRTRGSHGRLLAYVELPDGEDLGAALLHAGLARADDRWPHPRVGRYDRIEREARIAGVGIWSP